MKIDELLNKIILIKLLDFVKKPKGKIIESEKEKPEPKEQLAELYASFKDDAEKTIEPDALKIMEEYNKQPLDGKIVLQKLEAIQKEREAIAEQKKEIGKDRTYLEDQQKSFQRAKLEINKNAG